MVLFFIFLVIGIIVGTWLFLDQYDDMWGAPFWSFFGSIAASLLIFLVSQIVISGATITSNNVTYSQQIVSINDGKGLSGSITGNIFLVMGKIGDTQNFSYYRKLGDKQFVLDKRDASQSTIWTDSTADTARVDVTDKVYSCTKSWYSSCLLQLDNEFVHADFHVPEGSIKQDYQLDAQ